MLNVGCSQTPSVRMWPPRPAHPARTRFARARRRIISTRRGRRKRGEFLVELRGPAMRALGALPVGRPHQQFAVLLARLAMKFVDRHTPILAVNAENSSRLAGVQLIRDWK